MADEAQSGWTKLTVALAPTEKLFQSTTALDEPCVRHRVGTAGADSDLTGTNLPPVGSDGVCA